MSTMKALTLSSFTSPPEIIEKPIPTPTLGSVVVKILSSSVLSYANEVYRNRTGARDYPMPLPLTIGGSAIGRIHTTGPDTTVFKQDQLVLIDSFFKARDDSRNGFLYGLHEGGTEGGKKLMKDVWRDSTYAQYANIPLENVHPLNEPHLTSLNIPLSSLNHISRLLIPFGGLSDLSPPPGSTLLVYPSTGNFGSAAISLGLSLGCFVIASGRTASTLSTLSTQLSHPRLTTAAITGTPDSLDSDIAALLTAAKGRDIGYMLDLSPPAAAQSTHLTAAMMAMSSGGKIALMGGIAGNVGVNYGVVMFKNLRIQGRFMYEREHVGRLIGMVEAGLVGLEGVDVRGFGLEGWGEAFDEAERVQGVGRGVVICPNGVGEVGL